MVIHVLFHYFHYQDHLIISPVHYQDILFSVASSESQCIDIVDLPIRTDLFI